MPVLDGMAAWTTWTFWIWAFVTVDSATHERDLNQAGAQIGTIIVALVIAVFAARQRSVAERLPSWITVPSVGSFVFSVLGFGSIYLMGGSDHLELSDLAKMILVTFVFFALLSLPVLLLFRIAFVAVSYAMGVRADKPKLSNNP